MDIVDRLMTFKDYTGLSSSQFADKAGIPRPTLSQFLNGRNKRLSDDLTAKLHTAYPELNVLWLLFGEGSMVKDSDIEISEGKNDLESTAMTDLSPDSEQYNRTDMPNIFAQEFDPTRKLENISSDQEEFTAQKEQKASHDPQQPAAYPLHQPLQFTALSADPAKKIQSIMVFYTDNSFESFVPASSAKSTDKK